MDLSRTVAVPQSRPVTGGRALVALSIAALLAIGFVVEEVFPYLRLDPEALARYWPRRWWLLAHITAGTVALLTGPVQLLAGDQPAGDARASETGRRVCGKRRRQLDRRVLPGGTDGARMDVRHRDQRGSASRGS